jgi:hypothetical protein
VTISHVKLIFKIKDVKSPKHDNVKITRKGAAGLQRDNNLAGKIQREWTLHTIAAKKFRPAFSCHVTKVGCSLTFIVIMIDVCKLKFEIYYCHPYEH